MLLEFSCSNHKSIMNKVVFSAIATKDTSLEGELYDWEENKVLRYAAIYGANGSGKSNFIDTIDYVKRLVITTISNQPGDDIAQYPHKLQGKEVPSSYDLQFITNNTRYAYGFKIKNNLVMEEYLYFFPNKKKTKIFERNGLTVNIGEKFKKNLKISLEALKENRLFLSCAANFSRTKEVIQAFLFFKEELVIYNSEFNNWLEYSIDVMNENEELKNRFIKILNNFRIDVKAVDTKIEKKRIDTGELPPSMPEMLKNLLTSQEADVVNVKVHYEQFVTDLLSEESTGVKKMFEMLCPIIDILASGKVLICDELETGLHESIVHEIIKLFKYNEGSCAQLLFTTHDTSLLDLSLFRRDQIWFTQLDENRSTDLYSLVEIKNVRKDENIMKGYILGKYGAIPMLNQKLTEAVVSD